jgi:predicted  nucleic acid-binding Zn-ribbon protein
MSVSAAVLQELHRIHQQLSDLQDRLARGPRQVQVRQANVAQQEATVQAVHDKTLDTKKQIDQKQLNLRACEQRIKDWKGKLNTCTSNREYQTLQEQIAAAEMANSVLADEILESMEKIDQLQVEMHGAQAALESLKSELTRFRDAVTSEAGLVRGDISRLESELRRVEKDLPGALLPEYQRVMRGKGASGMAPVEDMVCQGCGKKITLNMQNELLMSSPVFCQACGSLLYLAD